MKYRIRAKGAPEWVHTVTADSFHLSNQEPHAHAFDSDETPPADIEAHLHSVSCEQWEFVIEPLPFPDDSRPLGMLAAAYDLLAAAHAIELGATPERIDHLLACADAAALLPVVLQPSATA